MGLLRLIAIKIANVRAFAEAIGAGYGRALYGHGLLFGRG